MGFGYNGQFGIGQNGAAGFGGQFGAGGFGARSSVGSGFGVGSGAGGGFGAGFGVMKPSSQPSINVPRPVVKPGGAVHQEQTFGLFRTDLTDGSQTFLVGNQSGPFRQVIKNGRMTVELDAGPMRYDLGNPGSPGDFRL